MGRCRSIKLINWVHHVMFVLKIWWQWWQCRFELSRVEWHLDMLTPQLIDCSACATESPVHIWARNHFDGVFVCVWVCVYGVGVGHSVCLCLCVCVCVCVCVCWHCDTAGPGTHTLVCLSNTWTLARRRAALASLRRKPPQWPLATRPSQQAFQSVVRLAPRTSPTMTPSAHRQSKHSIITSHVRYFVNTRDHTNYIPSIWLKYTWNIALKCHTRYTPICFWI